MEEGEGGPKGALPLTTVPSTVLVCVRQRGVGGTCRRRRERSESGRAAAASRHVGGGRGDATSRGAEEAPFSVFFLGFHVGGRFQRDSAGSMMSSDDRPREAERNN